MRSLAHRIAGLPRAWVTVLLVVAALDMAVVGAADGPAARTGALARLVASLDGADLVRDGALVASPVQHADGENAVVVDPGTATATAEAGPGVRSALVLAGDGLVLLDGAERWTVPYAGSLDATELYALLAGWQHAQRGPALLFATLTGVLATALGTAVLVLAVRMTSRTAGWGGSRPRPGRAGPLHLRTLRLGTLHAAEARDALAWWSAALAVAGTAAATLRLAAGGDGPPAALALAGTFAAATVGVGVLAVAARAPGPDHPLPCPATAP